MTQAEQIRDILISGLTKYNYTLDTSEEGRLYRDAIEPVMKALSISPFDTNIRDFIIKSLREQFPSMPVLEGDAIIDALVNPLSLLLEPISREIVRMRKARSSLYADEMTMEEAEALASNFFIGRNNGAVSTGTVRVLLSAPTNIKITDETTFSTSDGRDFYPLSTYNVTATKVASQQAGSSYYVDVTVHAAEAGDEYNVDALEINSVVGIPTSISVFNRFAFSAGEAADTKEELLNNVHGAITERSLSTAVGIRSRIISEFSTIKDVTVVGYGDVEMRRDILVSSGDGELVSSGLSMIIGKFLVMVSVYNGKDTAPAAGDRVSLNFGALSNGSVRGNEVNEVARVVFDSRESMPNIPYVYILQLAKTPSNVPTAGTAGLPGTLLAVGTAIHTKAKISVASVIADIESGSVHIGGKTDVWVRSSDVSEYSSQLNIRKSQAIYLRKNVVAEGAIPTSLSSSVHKNRMSMRYTINCTNSSLEVGEVITGSTTGAVGKIQTANSTKSELTITYRNGDFAVGETITGESTLATSSTTGVTYDTAPSNVVGSSVTLKGKTYAVISVDSNHLILSEDVYSEDSGEAYFHKTTGVNDIFNENSATKLYPEDAPSSRTLTTHIGTSSVNLPFLLSRYEAGAGDTLVIMEGNDSGYYDIVKVLEAGTVSIVTINKVMSSSRSNTEFKIVSKGKTLIDPMLSVIEVTSTSNGASSNKVPYGKPVGAYMLAGVDPLGNVHRGLNAVTLPAFTSSFKGPGSRIPEGFVIDPSVKSAIPGADVIRLNATEGHIVTLTALIGGSVASGSDVSMYVEGLFSTEAETYLNSLKARYDDIVDALFTGSTTTHGTDSATNLKAFSNLISIVHLGAPTLTFGNPKVLYKYELLIPPSMFDGKNNTILTYPDFDFNVELSSGQFSDFVTRFLVGDIPAHTNASTAEGSDVIELTSGPNKGVYGIESVSTLSVLTNSSVRLLTETEQLVVGSLDDLDLMRSYKIGIVSIKGEAGTKTLGDLLTIPTVPAVLPGLTSLADLQTTLIAGNPVGVTYSAFEVTERMLTAVAVFLNSNGINTAGKVEVDVDEILRSILLSIFSPYTVGRTSCPQKLRVLFKDPTGFKVTAPRNSKLFGYYYDTTEHYVHTNTPAIMSGHPFNTNPASLEGLTLSIIVNDGSVVTRLSCVLTLSMLNETDISVYSSKLQKALDITQSLITISVVVYTSANMNNVIPGSFSLYIVSKAVGASVSITIPTSTANEGLGMTGIGTVYGGSSVSTIPINRELANNQRSSNGSFFTNKDNVVTVHGDLRSSVVNGVSRDAFISPHVDTSTTFRLVTTGDSVSPMKAGVSGGDILEINEQRSLLDNSIVGSDPTTVKRDRVLHVSSTSNTLTIHTGDVLFTAPETGVTDDAVVVGDLVYFEDHGTYSTVIAVTGTKLSLSDSILVPNTSRILGKGDTGTIDSNEFSSASGYIITTNDVGKFVSVYGSAKEGFDGAYEILSVSGSIATIDRAATDYDTGLYWVLTVPPLVALPNSSINGDKVTLGVTPIRVYNGTPARFSIVSVEGGLDREGSSIYAIYKGRVPVRGVKQPFDVIRYGEMFTSMPDMKSNGTEAGLYYVDVPVTVVAGESRAEESVQFTPVVDSMEVYGYWLETKDRSLSFSTREVCALHVDSVLRLGKYYNDTMSVEGSYLGVTYSVSNAASGVQAFVDSVDNRNLNADILIRHCLPSYIGMGITAYAEGAVTTAIADYINGLGLKDSISVSSIEGIMHTNGVTEYKHPVSIYALTTDMSRDVILTRSESEIDDGSILHDGTNRITYFHTKASGIIFGDK